jgi:hypothetical protein
MLLLMEYLKMRTLFLTLLKSPMSYATLICLAAAMLVANISHGSKAAVPAQPSGKSMPVIVELFTSEGCSSCPPADALLKELSEDQPVKGAQIVALEEHVDYWNHLGWSDPFSSDFYSQRQNEYAQVFGRDGVYTPQMVVDGQTEFVGSHGQAARAAIQKAASLPKADIDIIPATGSMPEKLTFAVTIRNRGAASTRDSTELWVVVTEKGLQSHVNAGENSGETLKHAAVVRSLRKLDTLRGATDYDGNFTVAISPEWKRENLSLVVFLSEKNSRQITGVAQKALDSLVFPH